MEADSEISENKLSENKSILSLNFIYKRIIIKENTTNIKSNLRTLNYEKIAKYKMKKMNINFLLNSIYKFKKSLKKSNPFLKYIKNVKPYDYTNLITLENKRNILQKLLNNKNNMEIKQPLHTNNKEKILNLENKARNNKNFYFSRMSNVERKKSVHSRKEKIILIQKYIRGFLSKKILDEEVNKVIVKRFINKILIIQKNIRKFLCTKKSLSNLIVTIIHNERVEKSNKITDIFSLYHYRNFYKKNILIKKILQIRHDSILMIQKNYRSYIYIKKVKQVLIKEKNSYVLTYPYNAERVEIKIFMDSKYQIYQYYKCPIRNYFVLYIDKNNFRAGEYLCQMIVNGNTLLDKRYKYIVDKNNILYNLIHIGKEMDIKTTSIPENKNIKDKNNNKNIIEEEEEEEEEEESSDEFYYYCYGENSNSTNSYSTKSDKIQYKNNNNNAKNFRNNINNKLDNEYSLNNNNIYKNPLKKSEFDSYFKSIFNKIDYKYSIESQSTKKESSIQSQKIKYNNILDELCQSVTSSQSNFSLKNINSYSKKTHQTKFDTKKIPKPINKKNKLNSDNISKNKYDKKTYIYKSNFEVK